MPTRNYRAESAAQRHASPYRRKRQTRRAGNRMRKLEARLPEFAGRIQIPALAMPRLHPPRLDGWTSGRHASKLLSGFVFVAALALLTWVQTDYHWFVYADSVSFRGTTYLTHDDLFPMTGANGWNIFWLRPEDIRENVMQHPYVADANVRIELPNRIDVRVTEPEPIAVWMTDLGPMWVLADGAVLPIRVPEGSTLEAQLLTDDGRPLPTIVDMQRAAQAVTRLDQAVDADVLHTGLALIARVPGLVSVRYNRGIGLNFGLPDSPYWIYWGDGAEMDDKLVRLAMAQRMLEDGELSGQVIDVRFRDRLVVR